MSEEVCERSSEISALIYTYVIEVITMCLPKTEIDSRTKQLCRDIYDVQQMERDNLRKVMKSAKQLRDACRLAHNFKHEGTEPVGIINFGTAFMRAMLAIAVSTDMNADYIAPEIAKLKAYVPQQDETYH